MVRTTPLAEPWSTAARIAAWAPDAARELLASAVDPGAADDAALAHTSELMAKVFAVTGAWDLARDSYQLAAESWGELDRRRALALRELARLLPLAPFASDAEAIEAERALVTRVVDRDGLTPPDAPPPLLLRAVTELRRALAPRRLTGLVEAALELAPMEHALVMAVALGDARLTAAEWHERLLPSQWYACAFERVLDVGLVHELPALVAHPRLVSTLRGRSAIEMPAGVRYEELAPTAQGQRRFRIHPIGEPSAEVLGEAALEIAFHGGVLASDGVSSPA